MRMLLFFILQGNIDKTEAENLVKMLKIKYFHI